MNAYMISHRWLHKKRQTRIQAEAQPGDAAFWRMDRNTIQA